MTTAVEKRPLILRSQGHRHGPITRLISPGDIGEMVKPFVFLDYVNAPSGPGFGFHPHSGIATLTHPLTFDIEHEDSSGQIDVVRQGGVEWVVAGSGLWHRARPLGGGPVQGFQLWFALPPAHESDAACAQFIAAEHIPKVGPVVVLLGSHGDARSPITTSLDANCFVVNLNAGEVWEYAPPATHEVAWAFVQRGVIAVNGESLSDELAVFGGDSGVLEFCASTPCRVLVGSAARHEHPLVLGPHSVHTSESALASGLRHIADIGLQLKHQGRLA
jgi:redox-sensitive bicupin YhaK (pirin superfamily)